MSPSQRASATPPPDTNAPLATAANPTGEPDKDTGPVGDTEVIDAQEHVLGDDPRRVAAQVGGFHDSLSGRPVTADGHFADGQGLRDQGPIPEHRIVADDWAERRAEADAEAEDEPTA